ncbi:TonB-dependent receptor domain-containing protein [Sphingobacterium suaedae]|uniref:TonB-dependent receptor domain-containing protein n=1 Tax=Sphingobacterium suaedae TaxID=1686402 RepID=A0ABW5KKV2_9SPHI
MICVFIALSIYGQTRTVKLEKGRYAIKEILASIQTQHQVIIFYSDDVVLDNMHFQVDQANMPLTRLFAEMLRPYNLGVKNLNNSVFAVFSESSSFSETKDTIAGLVLDTLGGAVEFASIRLFDQNKRLIAIYNTDQNGTFFITDQLENDKNYHVQISALGFKRKEIHYRHPDTEVLRKISLSHDQIQLQAVEVNAKRRPFERIADRLIVQVEGSVLENGLSTLEILQRSPGIWIDPNGNIRLRGNQHVQVMINDLVQRMSSEQLAEYLRNLPSESISKIEIIPNPAAEYEASGTAGIIRIILRKNSLDGFRANLLARYLQQVHDPYYNVGTIMDFKKNRLFLTAVAGYLRNDEYIYASNDIRYADSSTYNSFTDRYRESKTYNGRLTAIYDVAKNQSLGFQAILSKNRTDQDFYTDNTHFLKQDTLFKQTYNNWLTKPSQFSSTLNYSWKRDSLGSSLKFLADYVRNQHQEENHYTLQNKESLVREQYINYSPSKTRIYSLQTDWMQYYKTSFNWLAGVKFIGTQRDNEVIRKNFLNTEWVTDPGLSNEFRYSENLIMGYVAFNYKKNKSSAKLGLRAEQTHVNARSLTSTERIQQDYLNLFPSVFLQHEVGNQHALFVNYAKRINRPSFKNLNPYTLQIDDFILLKGNADLKPEIAHRVETGIQLRNNMSIDIFFSYTEDKIFLFTETENNKTLVYQSRNFPYSMDFGTNMFIPWKLYTWWTGQTNAMWYRNVFQMKDTKLNQQTSEIGIAQFWKVKKWFDASLYLGYTSPRTAANTKYADQFYTSITLSKRIAKDKGKITLLFNDLFNTAREREWTSRNGAFVDFYQKRPTRTFGLSFSYLITKGKKLDDKKVEESTKEVKIRAN